MSARLREVAAVFLKLGLTGFGGPAAHIALVERECVTRRAWISREEFLDLLGAANLLPGPTSTELVLFVGAARGGFAGLLVAGACFIGPATLLVCALAAAYVRWGALGVVGGVTAMLAPVVLAIVLQALVALGRTALRSVRAWTVALVAGTAAALGAHPLVVLVGAAALHGLSARAGGGARAFVPLALPAAAGAAAAGVAAAPYAEDTLFATLLATGATLYGSGYSLLAFLRADFVVRLGWLDERTLLDAFAVGQATPGPVFTTATFVGWLFDGPRGALLATVAIFAPSFAFSVLAGPAIAWVRRSAAAREWLAGATLGSLALLAVACVQLAFAALGRAEQVAVFAAAFVLLARGVNATGLLLAAAVLGAVRSGLQ